MNPLQALPALVAVFACLTHSSPDQPTAQPIAQSTAQYALHHTLHRHILQLDPGLAITSMTHPSNPTTPHNTDAYDDAKVSTREELVKSLEQYIENRPAKTEEEYYAYTNGQGDASGTHKSGTGKPPLIKQFDNSYLGVVKPRYWKHVDVRVCFWEWHVEMMCVTICCSIACTLFKSP